MPENPPTFADKEDSTQDVCQQTRVPRRLKYHPDKWIN
jgi:hypothetical protein